MDRAYEEPGIRDSTHFLQDVSGHTTANGSGSRDSRNNVGGISEILQMPKPNKNEKYGNFEVDMSQTMKKKVGAKERESSEVMGTMNEREMSNY